MRQRPIEAKNDRVPIIGLVPRFYLGAIFAIAAYEKIAAPHGYVETVRSFLTGPTTAAAPTWYASFISTVVLPHIGMWATIVVAGEALIAVSLLLGLLARVGAAAAIYALANFMFAGGIQFGIRRATMRPTSCSRSSS